VINVAGFTNYFEIALVYFKYVNLYIRRLIATRKIFSKETILVEDAVVVSPSPNSLPTCPSCLKKVSSLDQVSGFVKE